MAWGHPFPTSVRFHQRVFRLVVWLMGLAILPCQLMAADLDTTRDLKWKGKYSECIADAKAEFDRGVWNEGWSVLLIETYLDVGRYEEALTVYKEAIKKYSFSIRLRMLGELAYRLNDQPVEGRKQTSVIPQLVTQNQWRFQSRSELVNLGQYLLSQGHDPKEILEKCFDVALKEDPKLVEAHLASARLALEKHDDSVAVKSLDRAVKLQPQNPEVHFLLAKAWSGSDSEKATKSLVESLQLNPKYVPSLLYQAQMQLDREDFANCEKLLTEIETIHPSLPMLWATRSVMAHLQGQFKEEGEFRRKALEPWKLNPEVDFWVGQKLSRHYRFLEAVQSLERALKMDPDYLPAKTQLAQDLLRLGRTEEGWALVNEIRKSNAYDVEVFNLSQLQKSLNKFVTLEAPGFVIRMDAVEARIYGESVVDLLADARHVLTERYQVALEEPTYVEIFPKQKDFAIRTFGLPGGEGFLGVCFGRLITANSPAALQVESNWQAVLWHEYCHVITLQKSKNRMPRWLSEGISVYEERQRDPRWGQAMDAKYREMILGEDLTRVSQLSGAFLQPKSPLHLQFAYYESSLVVEYWIEKYGLPSLLKVLDDLAVGMSINESLARYAGALGALDQEFAEFAIAKAKAWGSDADWDKDEMPERRDATALQDWVQQHPENYWAQRMNAEALIKAKQWEAALQSVQKLVAWTPDDAGEDGPHGMLAACYRALKREDDEYASLEIVARNSSDCQTTLLRLVALDTKRQQWDRVAKWSKTLREIQPMLPEIQEASAQAAEKTGDSETAVYALRSLLEMNPVDPAATHFRLARALDQLGDATHARRQVLKALEESPRYLDALELLKKLVQPPESKSQ